MQARSQEHAGPPLPVYPRLSYVVWYSIHTMRMVAVHKMTCNKRKQTHTIHGMIAYLPTWYGIFTNIYLDLVGFLWVFMSGKYIRPRPMDASPRTSLAHRLVLPKPPPKRQKKRTCRRRHDAGHKPKRRGNIRGHLKLRFGIWTTQKIPINILKDRTSGGIWMSRCPEKVGLYDLFHGELGMKHRDFLLQNPR